MAPARQGAGVRVLPRDAWLFKGLPGVDRAGLLSFLRQGLPFATPFRCKSALCWLPCHTVATANPTTALLASKSTCGRPCCLRRLAGLGLHVTLCTGALASDRGQAEGARLRA